MPSTQSPALAIACTDLQPRTIRGHNGLMLAADIGGPEDGPPVVLLHGGGQTRYSWGSTAQRLVTLGFRVVSMDLRGHGDSQWASDGDYSIDAFVQDLLCLSDTLSAPPALVGASLGGVTALLALQAGLEASALVMVDVVARVQPEGVGRIRSFMAAHPNGFATVEEAASAVARYLPNRPRPPSTDGLRKNLREGPDQRLYWHWDPAFQSDEQLARRTELPTRMEHAALALQGLPTLLVRGKQSELVSPEGARAMLRLIPQAELVHINGAGHMVAGDRNDKFNSAIESFLLRRFPCAR